MAKLSHTLQHPCEKREECLKPKIKKKNPRNASSLLLSGINFSRETEDYNPLQRLWSHNLCTKLPRHVNNPTTFITLRHTGSILFHLDLVIHKIYNMLTCYEKLKEMIMWLNMIFLGIRKQSGRISSPSSSPKGIFSLKIFSVLHLLFSRCWDSGLTEWILLKIKVIQFVPETCFLLWSWAEGQEQPSLAVKTIRYIFDTLVLLLLKY